VPVKFNAGGLPIPLGSVGPSSQAQTAAMINVMSA
jgi:hypothetical protein